MLTPAAGRLLLAAHCCAGNYGSLQVWETLHAAADIEPADVHCKHFAQHQPAVVCMASEMLLSQWCSLVTAKHSGISCLD